MAKNAHSMLGLLRPARRSIGSALLLALVHPAPAISQAVEVGPNDMGPEAVLLANIKAETDAETYLARLLSDLARLDGNGDGAGLDDIERARTEHDRRQAQRIEAAMLERPRREERRRQEFAKLDLDGNGIATRQELSREIGLDQAKLSSLFAQRDANGDDGLSLDELAGPAVEVPVATPFRLSRQKKISLDRLFDIDPDGDGHLTAAELTAAFRRQIARVDVDGNGTVSEREYQGAAELIRGGRIWARTPKCSVELPAPGAKVFAFHTSGGDALSTIEIGQSGSATQVVNVFVDPRDEPAYLVLSSFEPVIWRFSGSIDRIQQVLIAARIDDPDGRVAAGATGLAPEKLTFVEHDCVMPRSAGPPTRPAYLNAMRQTIAAATGLHARPASALGSVAALKIYPAKLETIDGALPPAPPGFDEAVWAEALGYWPNGVSSIELEEVVTATNKQEYDILPSHMGMAQLVARGAARETENFHEYLIVKPIARFPAALHGALSANFVLADGIPMPAGDQGHGCVLNTAGEFIGENDHCSRFPKSSVRTGAQLQAEGHLIELSEADAGDHLPVIRPVEPVQLDVEIIPRI